MSLKNATIGDKSPEIVNVIVEIPAGSGIKYETDVDTGLIFVDRVQPTSMKMPYDYGEVPGTLGDDGDPLDALIKIDEPLYPGVIVPSRVLGVLYMIDSGEKDEKLICVAADDKHYEHVRSIEDLGEHFKDKVVHYFENYKKLQDMKVEISGWGDVAAAHELIKKYQAAAK